MDKQKTVIIITHSADPDGIVSAAFITDILESAGTPYELRFADYPNLTEVIGKVARETDKSIYILDLGLSRTEISDEVIQPLLQNNEVHYFDHHAIEVERKDQLKLGLKTFVSNTEKICTAHLIAKHYKLEGKEYEILADCAQATDYNGTVGSELTALGAELAQAISPESGLVWGKIVRTIKEGIHTHKIWRDGYTLTGKLAQGAAKTRKVMQAATIQLEKSASCHEFFKDTASPVLVAIALSHDSLYMKPGYQALKQKFPEAQVCFALYESGSVFAGPGQSWEQSSAPLLAFLQKQGGGGRNNMGGFSYNSPSDRDNYEQRRDSLLQQYEDFLKRNSFDNG